MHKSTFDYQIRSTIKLAGFRSKGVSLGLQALCIHVCKLKITSSLALGKYCPRLYDFKIVSEERYLISPTHDPDFVHLFKQVVMLLR